MRKIILLVLCASLGWPSLDAWAAAAAVQRRQQMKAMQEKAIQEAMQQQYAQQASAQQQQAQQQAQIAQQQAIQQQMIEYQQQQMKAQVQQILMQVQQEKAAYAQVKAIRQKQAEIVDAQQMALVTQMTEKYQQAIMQEALKQKIALSAVQMAQVEQLSQAQAEIAAMQAIEATKAMGHTVQNRPYAPPVAPVQIEDVVDISDVWRKLDVDSRAWTLLVDNQDKVSTVSEYIDRFAKQGIKIQGPVYEYAQLIDQMAIENPTLLTNPFKNLIQLAAVMQYDFNNGMDKDSLARKMLGQQLYEANRKRLGR